MRSRSTDDTPLPRPWSTPASLTQLLRVCAVQPNLGARGPLGAVFVRLVEDQPNGPFMHFGRKAFPVLRPDILSRKEISWIPGAIQGVDNDFLE